MNSTLQEARKVGLSCNRIDASVITPNIPSEPIVNLSGLGPAPDPGNLLLSNKPDGVTILVDSTKSSIWVYKVAKCPPERVAIQPPKVENSKL